MRGGCPSLDDLDSNTEHDRGTRIYQVGFLLGEYIVHLWGQDGLVRAIQEHGRPLDRNWLEFESGWHAFMREKYGVCR